MTCKGCFTLREIIQYSSSRLKDVSESPYLDAQLLLAFSMGCSRTNLMAKILSDVIDLSIVQHFNTLIEKRLDGYPIAYLIGYKEFYGRLFFVDTRVLIPRPETEILVETVLKYVENHSNVKIIREVGFGSGAISLTLACELENKHIIASDISDEAYAVFYQNQKELSSFFSSSVEAFTGNLWDDSRSADILVSNLPYLTSEECRERRLEGWREPMLALNGERIPGDRGLGLIYELIKSAQSRVKAIFLEASEEQVPFIRKALHDANFSFVRTELDLSQRIRVVWAI